MDGFWLHFNDGLNHFLHLGDYVHGLTLIVLLVAFTMHERKQLFWVFALFNLGILFAMFLSVYDVISVRPSWIAFLVPLLIFGLALYHMFTAGKTIKSQKSGMLYFLGVVYGLIQGISLLSHEATNDRDFLNMIEYFFGLLIAQILILIVFFILGFLFQNLFRFSKRDWVLAVSAMTIGLIIPVLARNWF